jgi:hypothetical protein
MTYLLGEFFKSLFNFLLNLNEKITNKILFELKLCRKGLTTIAFKNGLT